jgi:hypothetical protein
VTRSFTASATLSTGASPSPYPLADGHLALAVSFTSGRAGLVGRNVSLAVALRAAVAALSGHPFARVLVNSTFDAQDGTTTSTYTLAITRQTGFETWAAENGVSTGSDRQFSNYAFGLPPGNQGSRSIAISGESISQDGSPVVLISNGGANIYALYGRRKDRSTAGLSYAVEFSGDLASWETATAAPSVIASDADTEAVVIPFPAQVAGKPTRFFRVTLTQ